ncbi:MAG: carboxypeptidase-like regulatory domain-containing protein [Paraprevotella sp.]|nr:carboxypeptidase-like regulatory domain-containing protein [Paraprevotella sp.]
MKRKLMLLLAGLLTGIGLVTAQTQTVKGIVIPEEDNQPVVGASVVVKGTAQGTITDADGKFVLSDIPGSARTLSVSYIGMQTQDVAVKPDVRVLLEAYTHQINEVVVTGYGSQRRASFTGAASIVGSDVLAKSNDANFVKALDGTVPGVQLNTATSLPGVWGSVLIR